MSARKRRRRDKPVVRVSSTQFGHALVDSRGFALYLFTKDSGPNSTCTGECAVRWPPYIVHSRLAATGKLGTVRRSDGRLQVTYAGHPLYYYFADRSPGQILCQGAVEFGGTWYVVAPDGRAIR